MYFININVILNFIKDMHISLKRLPKEYILLLTFLLTGQLTEGGRTKLLDTWKGNNNKNNNNNDDFVQRRSSRFFYNLLAVPRTVSNTYSQVAKAQSCENHVQHIERLSHATCCLPLGT